MERIGWDEMRQDIMKKNTSGVKWKYENIRSKMLKR